MKLPAPLARTLDRLSLYTPVIVMGVLALASWWLVRSLPDLNGPQLPKVVRSDPDYSLRNFSVQAFRADGTLYREVLGTQGHHYPNTDELHIEQVQFRGRADNGARMNAQAQLGMASSDGERVTLQGNAVAVREALGTSQAMTLKGQQLVAWPKKEELKSSQPVRIERAKDVFTGNTLDFNAKTGEYQLQGEVRAQLAPRKP
ncbi:LPS export ABC transporter periplasmic protein LptC [Limnohabitans sp.]|jgi:lipopolysaccharide export system protein LptC|uniref:LPS export ABC transporter periplasmic protein LptC n=1 Tax=Limnohabitans sp. TaxID=1907725 RepID=UPI00311EB2DC